MFPHELLQEMFSDSIPYHTISYTMSTHSWGSSNTHSFLESSHTFSLYMYSFWGCKAKSWTVVEHCPHAVTWNSASIFLTILVVFPDFPVTHFWFLHILDSLWTQCSAVSVIFHCLFRFTHSSCISQKITYNTMWESPVMAFWMQ